MRLLMPITFWLAAALFFSAIAFACHENWRFACGCVALSWLLEKAHHWTVAAYRERLDREAEFCRAKSRGIPL